MKIIECDPSDVDKSRKAIKSRLCGIFTFRLKSSEIVKIIRNGVKFGVKSELKKFKSVLPDIRQRRC